MKMLQRSVETCSGTPALAALRDAWNLLVVDEPEGLLGLDGTCSHEWFMATVDSLARDAEVHVVVCREGEHIVGLLPVAFDRTGKPPRRLRMVVEYYSGRTGFLLQRPDPAILLSLLRGLDDIAPDWRSLAATLVTGSPSETVLGEAARTARLGLIWGAPLESPFFPLQASEALFRADLSKNLKQNLAKARNRAKAGVVTECRTYEVVASVDELIDFVLEIDRQSWKHAAGTSISANPEQERFYRAAFPMLARAGLLFAEVMMAGGRPAAYNFGLRKDAVYSCLKHSQAEPFAELSPGLLLNSHLVDTLRSRGVVSYDFMGKAEEHKLRWSNGSRLYARRPLQVFNSSWLGRAEYCLRVARG